MSHTTEPSQYATPALRQLVATRLGPAADAFLASFPAVDGETQGEELRRLNRYWRAQLGQLDLDTISARGYLVDDCAADDWLRLFDKGVLPLVRTQRLPMV